MRKETYLKIFRRRNGIYFSLMICLIVLVPALIMAMLDGVLGSVWWVLVAAIIISFPFFSFLFWEFFKQWEELGEFWDNLVLFDSNFLPDIKKKYKRDLFRSRVSPIRSTNLAMAYRFKPVALLCGLSSAFVNIISLYFMVGPLPHYSEMNSYLVTMAIAYNSVFLLTIPALYILFLAIIALTPPTNFIVFREKDLLVVTHFNDLLMKNFIPYRDIIKVERKRLQRPELSIWKRFHLMISRRFHHPNNALIYPTLKCTELVSIRLRAPVRILQNGLLLTHKKPKRYVYIDTRVIHLEPKDINGFISEMKGRLEQ
jgi:hypothetical protein